MSNFAELLQKASQSAIKSTGTFFDESEDKFKALIAKWNAAGQEIRVFIPASSNFGAQSSSVSIMYYLASIGAVSIRIVYVESQDVSSTWGKLTTLILGLPAVPVTTYALSGTTTLNFTEVPEGDESPVIPGDSPFGITGGWDGNSASILEFLKVPDFCCLQTYLWKGQIDQPRSNQIYIADDDAPLEFSFAKDLEIPLRAYYTPDPVFSKADFDYYNGQDPRKAGCIQAIDALVKGNKALLIPVYFSPDRIKSSFENVFFNLFIGIANYKAQTKDARPVVIAVMSTPPPGYYEAVKAMFNGDVVSSISDTGELTIIEGYKYPSRYLDLQKKGYYEFLETVSMLTTDEECTGENITAQVNGGKFNIVLAGIKSLPKVAFDYMFGICNSFHIFEGMATASLALNLGKPFIRVLADDTGEDGNLYRLPPLSVDPNKMSFGQYGMGNSSAIGWNAAEWNFYINKSIPASLLPDALLGSIMLNSLLPNSSVYRTFGAQRTFYHDPIEDKLRNGLFYWQSLFEE